MACSKYTVKNVGKTPTLFNYRRCQDAIWQYEVPLNPGQSKNIWLIDGTYSTTPVTPVSNEALYNVNFKS